MKTAVGGFASAPLLISDCEVSTVLLAEFIGTMPVPLVFASVLATTTGSCVATVMPALMFPAEIGSCASIGWKSAVPAWPFES